jgi:hypothetical protein
MGGTGSGVLQILLEGTFFIGRNAHHHTALAFTKQPGIVSNSGQCTDIKAFTAIQRIIARISIEPIGNIAGVSLLCLS